MLKLIRLELKRNNLRTYLAASMISCIALLGFIYFIAGAAQMEDSNTAQMAFRSYRNIFRLMGVIGLTVFSTMAAIMYGRFILDEYRGKRAALLFSYPVSRSRILLAKLLLIFVFTSVSMLLCMTIPLLIFSITESASPIVVQDVMTGELFTDAIRTVAVAVLALGGIGMVSLRLGFNHKSVPATMLSAILLSAVYGNATINANGILTGVLLSAAGLIAAWIIIKELSNKVNKMEVD